ncbi:serine protease [Kitasatospora sp. NPDC049258]|uniref:trypsin-like serine peptidase n=1 Tax=Kitasatospora sp. NPDC049258 TaxID=3155394 RepID=UPI00344AE95F
MAASRREQFIVRIGRIAGESPAGVGFLIGRRQILTCAHVVNTALGRPKRAQERPPPEQIVPVTFPLLNDVGGQPFDARVVSWSPPPEKGLIGADVAGLVLDGLPPAGTARAQWFRGEPREQAVSLYGFPGSPPRREHGAWATATLRGRVGMGALQIDRAAESALRTQPGYSGGPVVVDGGPGLGDTVAGMLVVASSDDQARDAYATSVHHLSDCWPQAYAMSSHPGASAAAARLFRGELTAILVDAAADCRLSLPADLRYSMTKAEYRHALELRTLNGLLAVWGRVGIFRPGSLMAFTPHDLLVRIGGTRPLRTIPYAELPEYQVVRYTMANRRGGQMDYGILFVRDGERFNCVPGFGLTGLGGSGTRQPMARTLARVAALVLGDRQPIGDGPPLLHREYPARLFG